MPARNVFCCFIAPLFTFVLYSTVLYEGVGVGGVVAREADRPLKRTLLTSMERVYETQFLCMCSLAFLHLVKNFHRQDFTPFVSDIAIPYSTTVDC
jgi:hypothetical protein